MASQATNIDFSAASLGNRLFGGLKRFFAALVETAENNPRLKQAERLQRMSDEELAARGIAREDIGRLVFRDCFYL